MRLILVALCLYMIFGYRAHAQNSASTSVSVETQQVLLKKENDFSLAVDLSIDSNLKDRDTSAYSSTLAAQFIPAYRISSKAKIKLDFTLEQKNYADKSSEVSDTAVIIERDAITIGDELTVSPQLYGILPTNEPNRNDNYFLGALGATLTFQNKFKLFGKFATLINAPSFLQNFNKFERNNNNDANLNNRLRYTAVLSQPITDALSLILTGRYQVGWTYTNALRTTFILAETLSYDLDNSTAIYVQHTNQGNALQANGVNSNIRLYENSASTVALGLKASF